MTRRRKRSRLCKRVAVGGKPVRAVMAALLKMPGETGVWEIGVAHDEGCPSLSLQRLDACDCEYVELHAERVL